MKRIILRWTAALGYIGFIYATLGSVRNFTNFFRSLGVLGLLVLSGYISVSGICLLKLVRSKTRDWWRYALLTSVMATYFFFGKDIPSPEEKIHFYEYGIVGILFYRALESHLKNKALIFLGALISGGLAGWIDEMIQGITPGRYYDVKDIRLNVIAVGLGLVLLFVISDGPATTREGSAKKK